MNNNPSLISQIQKYFTTGPQVILLPVLQWDYAQMPDFNEEGFYLDYDHIQAAHPPLRDRMMYGLNKMAFSINAGVSEEESYFIKCKNFENLIENVYNGELNISVVRSRNTFTLATTEDVIDIGDLDYEWQLSEASRKLENYVKKFELYKIGLTDDVTAKVCPEANIELYECMESTTYDNVQAFYQECLDYIDEIFKKGADDLKQILGTSVGV